ncbi:DUF1858 domain-containing protein [Mesorhizobium sp. PAMC28654]|nr:DUF1858 domain-containing protein [Mesorhizobium sp. PAMC28654]
MSRWTQSCASGQQTIRVVLQHGMLCVGCPIAPFHTISEAAREHGLNEESLRFDLQAAIKRTEGD